MNLAPPTGQWFVADDGQRWWFDSGSIALDFAYTGGFPGPEAWELWHGPEDIARWWRERFDVEVPVDEEEAVRARDLRRAIADAVLAAAAGTAIPGGAASVIDEAAARPDVPRQLRAEPAVSCERLLATIARAAVAALERPERVRVCGADDCAVMYLDISRSGNRAWCSMRRCGNRQKVRALRARRAASEITDDGASQPREEHHS
ncbi:CGNR zinc finger domain-containing protein [Leucobacter allii]|uniref:CGNR zinc finger domain-containing protein n=1 Tax=Leucobacter allii TaxID=2932247 RepID=UPI001FD24797|nr:CGNR zinc finger domain-containing protein [Leucobacter allii]UOR01568.1 CGNR zinc finger domain-containing protein [Leucobacter allii]